MLLGRLLLRRIVWGRIDPGRTDSNSSDPFIFANYLTEANYLI
jgi:hypothetical protein